MVKTSDSRIAVAGSIPGHGIACLVISEIGDRLLRVNYLEM